MEETFFKNLFEEKEENKISYVKVFMVAHKYHITLYKIFVWPFIFFMLFVGIGGLYGCLDKVIEYGWDEAYNIGIQLFICPVILGLAVAIWVGLAIEPYRREKEGDTSQLFLREFTQEDRKDHWKINDDGYREMLETLLYFTSGNDTIPGLFLTFSNKKKPIHLFVGDFIRVKWNPVSDIKTRDYLTCILFTGIDKKLEKKTYVNQEEILKVLDEYFPLQIPDGLKPHLRRLRVKGDRVLIELEDRIPVPENKFEVAKFFFEQIPS